MRTVGDAGTDIATSSTCSIVGTFTNTTTSGAHVSIVATAGGTFTLTIMPPSNGQTTAIDGNYSVSGNQITMTNTSATPSNVDACIGDAAVYSLTYASSCSTVMFTKVSDTCQQRIGDANGATLTRS